MKLDYIQYLIFHVYNDISDNDSSSSDDIITSNPLPFKIVNSEEDRPPLKQFNNNCKYESFFYTRYKPI